MKSDLYSLSELQIYLSSCSRYNKLMCMLSRLSRHYTVISDDLISQINQISNFKSLSLSDFYKSNSIFPSSELFLQNLIDKFRDSIIITCQSTLNISHLNNNITSYNKHLYNNGLESNDNLYIGCNGSDVNDRINSEVYNSKRRLSELSDYCKKQCLDKNIQNFNNLTNGVTVVNTFNVDDILLHSLRDPSTIFKSPLLKEVFNGLDCEVMKWILSNCRVFVPELIIYLGNQLWIKGLLFKDESLSISLSDFTKSIDRCHNLITQLLNGITHNSLKSIYFQICGKTMSKEMILSGKNRIPKQLMWSNVYINRSRIMYRSSFNNFTLPCCSILKFRKPLTRVQCRILLNNILFNNDLLDDKKNEVVYKIKKQVESTKDVKLKNSKSLICNILDHFYDFMSKLHKFKFKECLDRHCPTRVTHLNEYIQLSQIPSLGYSIDIENVVAYMTELISNLITEGLLGNNHNKLIFLKTCRTLVTLNRNETLNIDRVIRNINTKNCKWIKENNNSYNRILVIRNYLSRLIYILHNHLTCPLLWSSFYVTESGNSINKLYYFRKSDWYKLERIADLHLSNSNYQISDKSIEYNKIRWVPKPKGMRPIWNLTNLPASSEFIESLDREQCMCNTSNYGYKCFKCYTTSVIKKTDKKSASVSRNTFLYIPRVILSYLCRYKSKLMGCSVMGYTQVYRRLSKWWNQFCSISRGRLSDCGLYIIVADLSMCYESISHLNLIKVIEELPIPRNFLFTRGYSRAFTRLSLRSKTLGSFGKCIDIIHTKSVDRSDLWLKKFKRQSILKSLIGGGVCIVSPLDHSQISVTRENVNGIINNLLKTLTITLEPMGIGKVIMKQTCGIPQGCCISSFLCSFYMANKDKLVSKLFTSKIVTKNNKSVIFPNLLLRWIDDFIFISPNKDDAMQMSKVLLDAKVFDARLNLNKLNANFEPYKQSQLEWLGMNFSFDILNEKINIEVEPWRNSSNAIRDSFSFKITKNFMQTMLIDRLYGYLSNRLCHGLFSCSKLNSREYITQNVYVIMRICMLKLVCGINSIIFEFGGFINYKFITDTIFNLIDHALTLISRRCKLYGRFKFQIKAYLLSSVMITLTSVIDECNSHNNTCHDKTCKDIPCHNKTCKDKPKYGLVYILRKLIGEYRKRIRQSKIPCILKNIILYKNNKLYNIANKIKDIEAKFEGKWPSVD